MSAHPPPISARGVLEQKGSKRYVIEYIGVSSAPETFLPESRHKITLYKVEELEGILLFRYLGHDLSYLYKRIFNRLQEEEGYDIALEIKGYPALELAGSPDGDT